MSDKAKFLAAIRAASGDDTPRLVYADWLDERDRPGGAILNAECELSAVPPTDPRRGELQAKLRHASAEVEPSTTATLRFPSVG